MTFEVELIQWLQSFRSDFWDFFFQFWTFFGEELVVIGILGFLYWCYDKKTGETIGLTVFISLVLNSIIKVIFQRPRPYVNPANGIDGIRLDTAGGYSFPSGHTQGAAVVFGSLAVWLKKRWLTIVSVVIIVMVAISRMYLGVHYLSDVLVGGLLGVGLAFIFHKLFENDANRQKIYLISLVSSIALFLISFVVYIFISQPDGDISGPQALYNSMEGVAKMVGAIVGFVTGIRFEAKHVQFENHRIIWKNILRFVVGVGIVMGVRIGLKEIFTLIVDSEALVEGSMVPAAFAVIFDGIRYGIMVFVAIGVYPYLFRKVNC
ncbi:MAG: phosphatase PAP2 family protein [Candidatus Izemoplasmatales bacterium]|nr:phosphatase PAP2 family protein [Candidatus Izemoplasmatales bacterium]MDY0373636.1 phosphatase PAP2 family protein [Candidatus Izemoplasmatales bacterium]